jgi:hypothetical protein
MAARAALLGGAVMASIMMAVASARTIVVGDSSTNYWGMGATSVADWKPVDANGKPILVYDGDVLGRFRDGENEDDQR